MPFIFVCLLFELLDDLLPAAEAPAVGYECEGVASVLGSGGQLRIVTPKLLDEALKILGSRRRFFLLTSKTFSNMNNALGSHMDEVTVRYGKGGVQAVCHGPVEIVFKLVHICGIVHK